MRPAAAWETWHTSRQGYDHRVLEAWLRGRGSDEALIALEAGARSGRRLRLRPRARARRSCVRGQGVGRDGACIQGQEARVRRSLRHRPGGSGKTESAPEAKDLRCCFTLLLPLFAPLIWVFRFTVPNKALAKT